MAFKLLIFSKCIKFVTFLKLDEKKIIVTIGRSSAKHGLQITIFLL